MAIINSVISLSLFLLGSLLFSQKEAFLSKLFKIKVLKWTKLGHQQNFQPNRSVHDDVDDVVGGLRGGFRVLACADTGSEDPPWRAPVFWSERSACAALGCWHKRRWPLF